MGGPEKEAEGKWSRVMKTVKKRNRKRNRARKALRLRSGKHLHKVIPDPKAMSRFGLKKDRALTFRTLGSPNSPRAESEKIADRAAQKRAVVTGTVPNNRLTRRQAAGVSYTIGIHSCPSKAVKV